MTLMKMQNCHYFSFWFRSLIETEKKCAFGMRQINMYVYKNQSLYLLKTADNNLQKIVMQ